MNFKNIKNLNKKNPLKKHTFLHYIISAVLILTALLAIATLLILKSLSASLPTTEEILSHEPSLATVVYDRNNNVLTRLFLENRSWIKFEMISPHMVKAILAAEDDKFYEHSGIRPVAIVRAGVIDLFHGGAKQGGSTITQQLARNLFLTKEKTIVRKLKEAILTLRMEQLYTKDQLLEMYLNTIYMGHGTYGISAAAKYYFNKDAIDLTITESAVLAGLVAAPEKYSPFRNTEASRDRRAYVLKRMLDLDWISKYDFEASIDEKLKLAKRVRAKNELAIKEGSYFVSHILFSHLLPTYGSELVYRGGLKVQTTVDSRLQKKAEELISSLKNEGALVALDPNTGEILAMVGGRDFEKSKFNRATQAYRQPGSAFKPLVYATGVEKGYRGIDHLLDSKLIFRNGWEPHNYSDKFANAEVTIMEALAKSINTPAVRMAQITGIRDIIDFSRRIGITSPYLPEDLSLALGAASVTPIEMAVAYSTFANNGFRVKPYGIREIKERTGRSLEQNGPVLNEVLSVSTAISTRSLLEQVTSWGTGVRGRIEGYETFGKTGTTNEWTDAWFAGGIPGLVVVVYVGNDNHTSLGKGRTGASVALPVWKEFVTFAAKELNLPNSFLIPNDAGIEIVSVCKKTGFLAGEGCPATNLMLPLGQAPTSYCPTHGGDYYTAQSDPNSPQFLVARVDEEMPSYVSPDIILFKRTPEIVVPKEIKITIPSVLPKRMTESAPSVAPEKTIDPYKDKENEQDLIEKKYQELLKKYNIS